jgi:hypothetical protein
VLYRRGIPTGPASTALPSMGRLGHAPETRLRIWSD